MSAEAELAEAKRAPTGDPPLFQWLGLVLVWALNRPWVPFVNRALIAVAPGPENHTIVFVIKRVPNAKEISLPFVGTVRRPLTVENPKAIVHNASVGVISGQSTFASGDVSVAGPEFPAWAVIGLLVDPFRNPSELLTPPVARQFESTASVTT
jgi:hypothetical protein